MLLGRGLEKVVGLCYPYIRLDGRNVQMDKLRYTVRNRIRSRILHPSAEVSDDERLQKYNG